MNRFTDKVAIVTGAGSGLGRATALRIASEGGAVACLDIAGDAAEKAAADAEGGRAIALACDVSDPESVRSAVETTVKELGRPSVVCNVAGVGRMVHTVEESLDWWNRTLAVNLTGTFLLCHATLPYLLDGGGVIVNVASSAGVFGQAYSAAYSASKGGVISLTRSLAAEYNDKGVRVCCVAPGGIDTPLMRGFMPPEDASRRKIAKLTSPMGFATPEDVANAVVFLASHEAAFVTGAVVPVDGGLTS